VLDQADWLTRLNLSPRDVGTGMADNEVSEWSARVNLEALRGYYTAAGQSTVEVVTALRPQELNEMPDLHRLHTEGVFREAALWAIAEREGQTKGWWLGHLGIGHNQMHRGEALTIRGLQGIHNR
jgi:hypothetical protein